MPNTLADKLVVAIASSALFDLSESGAVFDEKGDAAYRAYQREHECDTLHPGVAFPFVKRLLGLNAGGEDLVQVVLISKNDPDTGLRVSKSCEAHSLEIIRMAFLKGGAPHRYLKPYGVSLFLSANDRDVKECIMEGHPAGLVLRSEYQDDPSDRQLRIAFDFDGVLVDDEAEKAYRNGGIDKFRDSERTKAGTPHTPGPLAELLAKLSEIQKRELEKHENDRTYAPLVRIAIITSRDAHALERMVTTLRTWKISVDETHLLGGAEKKGVIAEFAPHIFFDDQRIHLDALTKIAPSVHVPFGVGGGAARIVGHPLQPST
jgi:5'-nucleotidase